MGIFDNFFGRKKNIKTDEQLDIKSELIKENLELIELTYRKALKEHNTNKSKTIEPSEWKNKNVFNILIEEFKRLYPIFVLEPIKNEVLNLFNQVLDRHYEKEKSITKMLNVFHVSYYTVQYFRILIQPLQNRLIEEYQQFPKLDIETNDENILLNDIFEEVWEEIIDDNNQPWTDIVDDLFYDIEVNLLSEFLSKCWNETKAKTNSNAKAILSEMSGVGETYLLDENRVLENGELQSLNSDD
jgi:hypothetical protein